MRETHEIETKPDGEIPEISPERQATFFEKNPGSTYYLFCGDERELTSASAEALSGSKDTENADTALRYYGGVVGVARVLATTVAAQYGPEALQTHEGTFTEFTKNLGDQINASQNLLLGAHSAHGNEGDATHLNDASEKGIGCAYAAGAEVVTELNASQPIVELGHQEDAALFGDDSLVDVVADANTVVKNHFSQAGTTSFNMSRTDLQQLDKPVAILEGAHVPVDDAVVVMNFHADKISNPRIANENNVPYFNNDVTQVAEILIKAHPDLDLNPRILLAVMAQDIRATREALASHEGKHAADLKLERFGDPEAAVAYLESVKNAA